MGRVPLPHSRRIGLGFRSGRRKWRKHETATGRIAAIPRGFGADGMSLGFTRGIPQTEMVKAFGSLGFVVKLFSVEMSDSRATSEDVMICRLDSRGHIYFLYHRRAGEDRRFNSSRVSGAISFAHGN